MNDAPELSWRWVAGVAGLWFVLAAGAEIPAFADITAALAISIAIAATYRYAPAALAKLQANEDETTDQDDNRRAPDSSDPVPVSQRA